MKDIIKMVIMHFFIITVCVMFVISFINVLANNTFYYLTADFPWVIMLTGLLTALPSILFYFRTEPTKKQFITRVIIHCIFIEGIVMVEGAFFKWYTNPFEVILIFGMIIIVYVLVWFFSYIINLSNAKGINEALKRFNNSEDK